MEHNLKEYNRQVIEEFREKRSKGQVEDRIVEQYPFFADHQAKITRQIPVIALERRDG